MRTLRCRVSGPPDANGKWTLGREESAHLVRVLRAGEGTPVEAFDGCGSLWIARLGDAKPNGATLSLVEELHRQTPPPPRPGLALAMTKSSAFEDAIERAVELGAGLFLPLHTEHTIVKLDAKRAASKTERWRKLAAEALKQCERLHDMEVASPCGLDDAVALAEERSMTPVALVERAGGEPLAEVLEDLERPPLLLVGPEGGWSEPERERLAAVRCATLGSGILRSETAAIAGLGTILAHTVGAWR